MTLGAVTENIYTCTVDNYLLSVVMVELLLMASFGDHTYYCVSY